MSKAKRSSGLTSPIQRSQPQCSNRCGFDGDGRRRALQVRGGEFRDIPTLNRAHAITQ